MMMTVENAKVARTILIILNNNNLILQCNTVYYLPTQDIYHSNDDKN